MTRKRAFTTAAARRRKDPIEWEIDDQIIRLRASVDITEIADLVDDLQTPAPEGVGDIRAGALKRQVFLDIIRTFIEPEYQEAFAVIEADLDAAMLVEMIDELVTEYTGADHPTVAPSSLDGSDTTGPSSMDGAAPEA